METKGVGSGGEKVNGRTEKNQNKEVVGKATAVSIRAAAKILQ